MIFNHTKKTDLLDSILNGMNIKYFLIESTTHIAQNVADTCQKFFQSFIAIEILPQHFYFIAKLQF